MGSTTNTYVISYKASMEVPNPWSHRQPFLNSLGHKTKQYINSEKGLVARKGVNRDRNGREGKEGRGRTIRTHCIYV